MGNPTSSQVHIDAALTQVSQKIPVQAEKLIATKILPVISVTKDTDKIFVYGSEHLRIDDDSYTPGSRAKSFDWSVTKTDAYALKPYAKEGKIIWANRDNADEPIKYEQDTIGLIRENQLVIFENRVATVLATASNFTSTAAASALWTDDNNSNPIADIDSGRNSIHALMGLNPNTMVMSWRTWNLVRRHPKLTVFYQYVQGGKLNLAQMKELFEVENILIGEQIKVGTKEGQTVVMGNIWDNTKIQLLYVAPTPGLQQISYGYTYRKKGFPYVDRGTEPRETHDWVVVHDSYDWKVQSADCGFLLTGVVSA